MPAKFRVKKFRNNQTYYIYSRAAQGRNLFEDDVDYDYWVKLLARYAGGEVEPEDKRFKSDRPYRIIKKKQMALVGSVKILAYCLLQKNIRMLVWQRDSDSVTKLMRRTITSYTMYLNRRHGKKGKVFAGVYKGVEVRTDEGILYLSRKIHRSASGRVVRRFGPVETVSGSGHEDYMYSSYNIFTNNEQKIWLDSQRVLNIFDRVSKGHWLSYKSFVDDETVKETEEMRHLTEISDIPVL